MQIQLTKEQQDAVGRIKVEGGFDELYYDGPLRRGRVVVRCEGMNIVYTTPTRYCASMDVSVVTEKQVEQNDFVYQAMFDVMGGDYIYLKRDDHIALATSQTITPYAAELDWSGVGVRQSDVDVASCILAHPDGPKNLNNGVCVLFDWGDAPKEYSWWNTQDNLYDEGTLTPELREALESYLAYAARLGVTPTVEVEKAAEPKPETDVITISIKDLRRIVRYGFDGPEQKFIDLERILKGLSV